MDSAAVEAIRGVNPFLRSAAASGLAIASSSSTINTRGILIVLTSGCVSTRTSLAAG